MRRLARISQKQFAQFWETEQGTRDAFEQIGRIAAEKVNKRRPEMPDVSEVRLYLNPDLTSPILKPLFDSFGQKRVQHAINEIRRERNKSYYRQLIKGATGDYFRNIWQR